MLSNNKAVLFLSKKVCLSYLNDYHTGPFNSWSEYLFKYLWVLLSLFITSLDAAPVRIASDIWCPYVCDKQTGYVVELTQRAFEIQGKTITFSHLPYKRALVEAASNHIDAVLAVTPSALSKFNLISGDVVIGYQSNDFYTVVDSKEQFTQLSDVNATRQVAVVIGYNYGVSLEQWLSTHPSTYFASGNDPLAMNLIRLIKGRHSVIIDNKNAIEYTVNQLNLTAQIRYAGTIGIPVPLYVGFNQHNKHNAITFAKGIAMLKASGEYQNIINKYKVLLEISPEDTRHKHLQKFLPMVN